MRWGWWGFRAGAGGAGKSGWIARGFGFWLPGVVPADCGLRPPGQPLALGHNTFGVAEGRV